MYRQGPGSSLSVTFLKQRTFNVSFCIYFWIFPNVQYIILDRLGDYAFSIKSRNVQGDSNYSKEQFESLKGNYCVFSQTGCGFPYFKYLYFACNIFIKPLQYLFLLRFMSVSLDYKRVSCYYLEALAKLCTIYMRFNY